MTTEAVATNSVVYIDPPQTGQWTIPDFKKNCIEQEGLPFDISKLFGWPHTPAPKVSEATDFVEQIKTDYSMIREDHYTIKCYLAGYAKEDIKLVRIHKQIEFLELVVENHHEGSKRLFTTLRPPQLTHSSIKIDFQRTELDVANGIFTFKIMLSRPVIDPNVLDLEF